MSELTESEIQALCERHPLPEGVEDCVMSREELAETLQVSLNTVSSWLSKGMPMLQEGGAGKAYELQLSACWAWRQAQRAEEDSRTEKVRRAQAAMRLALVGGTSGNSMEALDPKTRREILAAQIEQERFQRERNQLMRRDDVHETFELVYGIIRDRMNAAPDLIERKNALEPKVVQELIDACDDVVADVRGAIDRFWRERPVREGVSERRDLFDA
ncbi:terminase small subunit [Sinorhizobium sp. 8-89]|uniref:terminase small subunit n=1 Tax=Sinorhizobium sp. 7-81 TaxID=3049087 RepID=UPI0024C455A0|nr:terminase small subunit [Sinorhizobium sp. 7-81]MDK1386356.1 terminase small subunit [Sinorhizobium sp. 7-81]